MNLLVRITQSLCSWESTGCSLVDKVPRSCVFCIVSQGWFREPSILACCGKHLVSSCSQAANYMLASGWT